jgi:glycosyltransferase involved in cell wall biosynthesis
VQRMKPVKSCVIVVENLPLPLDRRVWQEANALKEDGWQVAVICPKTDKFPESYVEINGIHIYRHYLPLEASGKLGFLLEYGTALFHELRLLLKVYNRHGFSVIQACNPPDLIFLVAAPFKLLGKKFVFDHHDICPELFAVKFGRKGFLHTALCWAEKLTYWTADAVITANETFRQLTIKRTGKKAEKITSVYSVPDKKNIQRVEPDASLRKGKRLLIGYIGIIGNQDGVDHLVRAVALLKQRGVNDIHTVIIGDGTDLEVVRNLAKELNVTDEITFTGYLTGQDLFRALSSIDIGVIPDPVNEYNDKISMNKVFEYSTLGIPIVSYRLTETQRLLGDAVQLASNDEPSGLADAIAALTDDAHRQQMAQKAKALAEANFSWEKEKAKYVAVMNGVLDD